MRTSYHAGQFAYVLGQIQNKKPTCIVHITADIGGRSRSQILVLRNGGIVYAGLSTPDNVTFVKALGKKLNRPMVKTAVNFALPKLTNKNSTRELLELIIRLRILKWEEIESLVFDQVVQTFEQILPHAGEYWLEEQVTFDLTHAESGRGLSWLKIKQEIEQRQQGWQSFSPLIPSMNAIPRLQQDALARVTDISVLQQLQQQVDGMRSLVEIADMLNKDPLKLGRSYLTWAQAGWISCDHAPQRFQDTTNGVVAKSNPINRESSVAATKTKLPLILSVDDSQIVQITIKRMLSDRYEVMLCSNAIAALNILNTNQVDLLLLDVTMPDIDGLEFCETIREMPQFKKLPIIMVTAKDSIIDKFRGFVAGSNQYLYKPIEPEKLLEMISLYIKS